MLAKVIRMIIVALFTLAMISAVFVSGNPVMAAATEAGYTTALPLSAAEGQSVEKLEL